VARDAAGGAGARSAGRVTDDSEGTRGGGARRDGAPRLSRNVKALAAVSLLADVSSDMIYPLLPTFMAGVLGASASVIGGIEGAAESTASMLKLVSGWWSDRLRRRKHLVVGGYTLSAIARPLIGITALPWHALVVRVTDRVGKGVRASPRDALLAHVRALADEIAANAPLAVQAIKRTIDFHADRGISESLRFEASSASVLFTSDDMTEGYRAMAAKQTARFEGK